MSKSQKFAHRIAHALRNHQLEMVKGVAYKISGELDTGVVIASVEVLVPWKFCDLKRDPPMVLCKSPWMKSHVDWHNSAKFGMCWVIPNQWRDAMNWKGKPVEHIIDEGVSWMLTSSINLINRHYSAELEGITEWDPQWGAWDHFDAGVKQYEQSKLRK